MGMEIAKTILDQMGGTGRLKAMLGVQQFIARPHGVAFKWPSRQPSRGNYVEILLTPADEYDMTFYQVRGMDNKKVKEFKGIYFDQLVELFERQTGLYLRLGAAMQKRAGEDKSWRDGDPNAPKTPWGPAQGGYMLDRWVWNYTTAGHGGIMVAPSIGIKKLTGAALKMAEKWNGAFWYEEDAASSIPFYEVAEWRHRAAQKGLIGASYADNLEYYERVIRRSYPQYFRLREQGHVVPGLPKTGDSLEFRETFSFRDGTVFQPGDQVTAVKITRNLVTFRTGKAPGLFAMRADALYDGKAVKVGTSR